MYDNVKITQEYDKKADRTYIRVYDGLDNMELNKLVIPHNPGSIEEPKEVYHVEGWVDVEDKVKILSFLEETHNVTFN